MKADLVTYGAHGFHSPWPRVQRFDQKEIARRYAEACLKRNIGLCGITSCQYEIVPNSPDDRFHFVENQARLLPSPFKYHPIGENIFMLNRHGTEIYFVNSQTVITDLKGNRLDFTLIGTNNFPSRLKFEDVMKQASSNPSLTYLARYPDFMNSMEGVEALMEFGRQFSAIEGHVPDRCLPTLCKYLPALGVNSKAWNKEAQRHAHRVRKPWVSISRAHRFEDIGKGAIEVPDSILDGRSEQEILTRLRDSIVNHEFRIAETQTLSLFEWGTNILKFKFRI